jgi:hypothetical protein
MSNREEQMLHAHQRGCHDAKLRFEHLMQTAVHEFATMDERFSYASGFVAELQRITQRTFAARDRR